MALIHCPECGKEISSFAPQCPNCGFPVSSMANSRPADDAAEDAPMNINKTSDSTPELPQPESPTKPPMKPKRKFKWWWLGCLIPLLLPVLILLIVVVGYFLFGGDEGRERDTTGTHNGYSWVDLGLSVKWATCNVGANSPEDYGDYYAWGETSTKSSYTMDNCATWDKNIGDISGTYRDIAAVEWGGGWRMPTKEEFEDLLDNCDWDWITYAGVDGYKVTGPNGNSIFLPAAGYRSGEERYSGGSSGLYWSSTPFSENTQGAYSLYFNSGYLDTSWYNRGRGHTVRPVLE